jgi:DNA-binding beta-propeller fold protein YncE
MKQLLGLGFVLFFCAICISCGETYRPIIYPNPPVFPNPAGSHSVVSINDNTNASGTVLPGSAMTIDVSGDSEMTGANVGLRPMHAAQQNATEVLVANQSVSGAAADSITRLNFSGTSIASTSTISLPENSAPNFVAIAPLDTYAYVTLPGFSPPSVGAVNTNTNTRVVTVPVGSNPYALAVTPDKSKLYVANQGDGTISAFTVTENSSTVDLTSRTVNGPLTSAPLWLAARTDSQQVYVLETNGTLASIAITSTIGPDTLTESSISVPGATTMTYDSNLNRLYIPGGQEMEIVDVSQSTPQYLAGGPIPTCQASQTTNCMPTVAPSSRGATDPCSLTSAQTLTVAAVAALPDGSRAYVGSYYEDANHNICPQVTAINAKNYAVESTIAVPGFPAYEPFCAQTRFRMMMAAAGDSTRAYMSSCDGGNVSFMDTSTDTYFQNLTAPASGRLNNPPQNPVFLLAGP